VILESGKSLLGPDAASLAKPGSEQPARRRPAERGRFGFGVEDLAGLFRGAGGVLAHEGETSGGQIDETLDKPFENLQHCPVSIELLGERRADLRA
jgi:hypothetical protein